MSQPTRYFDFFFFKVFGGFESPSTWIKVEELNERWIIWLFLMPILPLEQKWKRTVMRQFCTWNGFLILPCGFIAKVSKLKTKTTETMDKNENDVIEQ